MSTSIIKDITQEELDLIRQRLRQEITLADLDEKMSTKRKQELSSLRLMRFGQGMSWLDVRVTVTSLNNGLRTHVDPDTWSQYILR